MVDASSVDHSFPHAGKTASYYFCYFPIKTTGKHQRRNDLIKNVVALCTAVCILQITLCREEETYQAHTDIAAHLKRKRR